MSVASGGEAARGTSEEIVIRSGDGGSVIFPRVVVDGGSLAAQCIPRPTTCSAGQATCACVQAVQGIGCSCVEQHGDVTVTCELP